MTGAPDLIGRYSSVPAINAGLGPSECRSEASFRRLEGPQDHGV